MKLDNGILILQLSDQSRVTYTQGVSNIYWSFVDMALIDSLVPTRIVDCFHDEEPMTMTEARKKAYKIESEVHAQSIFLENGIRTIVVFKTWKAILEEARELVALEVKAIDSDASLHDTYQHYIHALFDTIESLSTVT